VTLVIEFSISSSVYPSPIFAATYARGYPVALEASAEDLDSLAFTSITLYSVAFGL
jgi:hypothetical protein